MAVRALLGVDWKKVARERKARLKAIAQIIEGVDRRCSEVDGPVSETVDEITQSEMQSIYRLARGMK